MLQSCWAVHFPRLMNYDSYLLVLAYFSGVTVELRAAGSDGSGETKQGAARMRIALLERKKTLKKKKSPRPRGYEINHTANSFLFPKGQREKGVGKVCVCARTCACVSTMKTTQICIDFILSIKDKAPPWLQRRHSESSSFRTNQSDRTSKRLRRISQ